MLSVQKRSEEISVHIGQQLERKSARGPADKALVVRQFVSQSIHIRSFFCLEIALRTVVIDTSEHECHIFSRRTDP